MTLSIALAAGGTGGHLLPALAVADEIRSKDPGIRVLVIGSTREMDEQLLSDRGLSYASTDAVSFGSKGEIPRTLVRLLKAMRQARGILAEHKVAAVLGFGGYPSLPAMLAAARARTPRLVHEANALPQLGLANRIAARAGAEIFGGFPTTGASLSRPVRICGVPLRREIVDLDRERSRSEARSHFSRRQAGRVILIAGGSLGARAINQAVSDWVRSGLPEGTELIWSTGSNDHQRILDEHGSDPRISMHPFIREMPMAYAAADAVVCRAGASTVAELEHLGIPAVLVPLAIARQSEQDLNATHIETRGAGVVVAEGDLDAPTLASSLERLQGSEPPAPDPRHASAATVLADRLIELAGSRV